ncbi:hypothetical protein LLG96_14075 [bacterium]|nr:hypothetical protein [bacterium]
MNQNIEKELRDLLLLYEVCEPRPELVFKTKQLMKEELALLAVAPARQVEWVFMLVGLAFVMCMGLFYTFTVSTILNYTLPSGLTEYLRYTMSAFAAAGGLLIAGMVMVFYFKQFHVAPLRSAVGSR